MRDVNASHKPAPLGWPWAVKRMIEAAALPPPRNDKRRWTFMGLR